jgi:hypothetical protein
VTCFSTARSVTTGAAAIAALDMAAVKAVFAGKVVGKQASGTYEITSADGSGCSGHGTWKAKWAE